MIKKAIQFALLVHDNQTRKGSTIPYIFHPLEVGIILRENTPNEDIVCAGILHDTVEDALVPIDMIRNLFNDNIAEIVASMTEEKGKSWDERKQHTIDFLREKATEAQKVASCADKLSNIRSIRRDYNEIGDGLWNRFNAGQEKQKWYYQSLVQSLASISKYQVYIEFKETVVAVFGEIHSSDSKAD